MDCALADLARSVGRNREKHGIHAAGNITPIGGNGLGGGGGSWRADIGDEVCDGEIGLVTDAGDDGHAAGVDGAGDDFFVEWPQLFDGAAATSENDDVDVDEPVQLPDGFSYADCGLGALDRARGEDDLRERPATAKDVADVVEYSAGGRGNDADAGGEAGQGAFAGLVEEAVGGELLLEAFEFRLASAHSGRLYEIDDQLDVAALLVEGDVAVGEHLGAAFERRAAVLALEHDASNLSVRILEGEVDVAALGACEVGDLALHPEVGEREVALKEVLQIAGEGGDGGGFNHGEGRREEEARGKT